MAEVTVRMFATLRSVSGSSEFQIEVDDLPGLERAMRARFGDGLGALLGSGVSPFETVVVLVNGFNVRPNDVAVTPLRDGDEVSLFPPISGG
ncbi:MAG TPA: MoaD family protein [Thermoplasmata archaeon]|nr:MoaD family protein [Thermoplasmata archaeon]